MISKNSDKFVKGYKDSAFVSFRESQKYSELL